MSVDDGARTASAGSRRIGCWSSTKAPRRAGRSLGAKTARRGLTLLSRRAIDGIAGCSDSEIEARSVNSLCESP